MGQEPVHADFEDLINYRMGVKRGSEISKDIAGKIKDFYYPIQRSKPDLIQTFYDVEKMFCFFCL